jgi:hypothetical protein
VFPSEDLPAAPGDDYLRPSDVVSMQFSTPASITIRRPIRSPRVDPIEKKKRPDFPIETIDPPACPVSAPLCLSDVDFKLVVSEVDLRVTGSVSSDLVDPPIACSLSPDLVDLPVARSLSPDLVEITDLGFVVCPFDLRISTELHRSSSDVKPNIEINPPVPGPLDDLSDVAFDEFVPSLSDCVLSESVDGGASDDETANPESNPANTKASRWGSASVSDYEVVRKGGVRKSCKVEAWANKAFDEWRAFRGYCTTESIVDLSEKVDVTPLVDMLVQYFLELKTQKLTLYSP